MVSTPSASVARPLHSLIVTEGSMLDVPAASTSRVKPKPAWPKFMPSDWIMCGSTTPSEEKVEPIMMR